MQPEFVAQAGDGLAVGLFELDPDEAVRLADMVADVGLRDGLGFGIVEEQAVDGELQLQQETCGDFSPCRPREFNMARFCPLMRRGGETAPFI
jgi:hypothetical protein